MEFSGIDWNEQMDEPRPVGTEKPGASPESLLTQAGTVSLDFLDTAVSFKGEAPVSPSNSANSRLRAGDAKIILTESCPKPHPCGRDEGIDQKFMV